MECFMFGVKIKFFQPIAKNTKIFTNESCRFTDEDSVSVSKVPKVSSRYKTNCRNSGILEILTE